MNTQNVNIQIRFAQNKIYFRPQLSFTTSLHFGNAKSKHISKKTKNRTKYKNVKSLTNPNKNNIAKGNIVKSRRKNNSNIDKYRALFGTENEDYQELV